MTVKRLFKRIWDFLGSRDLSVFIFVMGMTYFLVLIIFATVVPSPRVTAISKLLPYKVLYILFFINLIVCEIKWIPVIIRRCRKQKPPETAEEMERFRHRTEVGSQESGVRRLEKYLRRKGYKVQGPGARGQGSEVETSSLLLHAYRGRFSPLGSLLFHLSFLFFLIGVGMGILYRFDGSIRLAEGQEVSKSGVEYIDLEISEHLSLPKIYFKAEKVAAAFWGNKLLFTELKADISFGGGKGTVRIGQPLKVDRWRKVTMAGIGITPHYILKDGAGRELKQGDVNLNIFAPGNIDAFQIPGTPYVAEVSFYPDFEDKAGKASSRSMNTVNPVYDLAVRKSGKRAYRGLLKPGEEAYFDGLSLSFPSFKYNGVFTVVYDGGFIFVWIGFILLAASLLWRLLLYRREIIVWQEGDKTFAAGRSDYYQNLFSSELRRISMACCAEV